MDADLKQRLNYELTILEEARKKYAFRLELLRDCKGALLRRSKKKGRNYHYYYAKKSGSSVYSYLGNERHPEVKRIREARYVEEAITRIDRDISLLKALENGYLSFDPVSISESIPKVYRFNVPPVSEMYVREGKKWLARRSEFQKSFPENYPERKTYPTSDGIMVKSVSEVVLYERFKAAGLIQIYELPFLPKDHGPALYPDDTILSPIDMKSEIIVEYFGMMDLMNYRGDFAQKVGRYIDSGYIPGVNLFFVFSDKNGHIDSMQITKVIADIQGIRNGSN